MKHNLNNINLPKDSRNKQLEAISKNNFRPLFDVERFIVKEEIIDNGIDFRFEIKEDNNILGFGFNFQLKSTETIQKNTDGSYSKNIETSNMEYLLNNGQPAFYGFYIEDEKTIYFENLKKVISDLNKKNKDWEDQPNHTIRFSQKLDKNSIDSIYNIAFEDGLLLRKLNSSFAENFSHIDKQNKIIIDFDYNLITDSEISSYIEQYGLLLTDKCRWNEVIKLHEKSSTSSVRSPKYNLILGICYYYTGEYFKSLDFFKESYKNINLLDSTLVEYLKFFHFGLQRILGVVSKKEYEEQTKNFVASDSMYIYKELELSTSLLSKMYTSEDHTSLEFENKITEITNNPSSSKYLILLAKIEFLFYRSEQLICSLISLIEFGHKDIVESQFNLINKEYYILLNETIELNSQFINNFCLIRHSRFIIHFDCIVRRRAKSEFLDNLLPDILKNIEVAYSYFKEINHVENELYTLTILLEYYQNLESWEKVEEVNNLLDKYKYVYLNPDFNRRIDFTKDKGTFVNFIIESKKKIDSDNEEIKKMHAELIELDNLEKESGFLNYENSNTVNLFPIGYFQFPKDKIEAFFEVLKIKDEKLKSQLINMFKIVIPVINCYQLEIEKEGILKGNFEYRGLESYMNTYRIRKQMFESKFYRKELKFGR